MAEHAVYALLTDPWEGEEAVVDGELHFPDDVEAVTEEEVVVPMNAPAERVLDGQNSSISDPQLDGLERDLELVARDGLAVRVGFPGGGFAVGAGHALVGDAQGGAMHRRGGEVSDGERLG